MVQYLPDDHWILNAGDHPGRGTADSASFHVNVEHPFQSLSPGHCHMTLRGCFLILISSNFPVTLAPLGRSYPHSVFAVRRKNTMVSGQVDSGFGYQGGQFGDEIYWLENDVSRATAKRGFQFIVYAVTFAHVTSPA
jgi:hypothetical protein